MTKVLYVIADSSQTGAPRQLLYLATGLQDKFDIQVLCPEGWLADELKKKKIETTTFKPNLDFDPTSAQLKKILNSFAPNIVHYHGVKAGAFGRLATQSYRSRYQARVVYTEHLWTADFHLPSIIREKAQLMMLRYLARQTDHTIAVSDAVKQFLINSKIVRANKIRTIYGAVEPLGSGQLVNEPVIGTIGTLTWVKGVDQLLTALPLVIREIPDLKCRVAGDGPDLVKLKQLADSLGIAQHIEWLGQVNDPAAFYRTLAVYVQPSQSESFGMAPLEAMSAGVPTLAHQVGALPEIIENGVSGLLYASTEQLSQQLIKVLSDKAMAQKLGEAGRHQTEQFSVGKMVAAHVMLYEELLHE